MVRGSSHTDHAGFNAAFYVL